MRTEEFCLGFGVQQECHFNRLKQILSAHALPERDAAERTPDLVSAPLLKQLLFAGHDSTIATTARPLQTAASFRRRHRLMVMMKLALELSAGALRHTPRTLQGRPLPL